MIAAAAQVCPSCGRMVIGGHAPPSAADEVAPPRWQYVQGLDEYGRPKEIESRSAGITVLGASVMVLGACGFLFAFSALFLGPLIFSGETLCKFVGEPIPPPPGPGEPVPPPPGVPLSYYLVFLASAVLAILFVGAGVGVLRRRQWGRFLALGCSGLLCVGALLIAIRGGNVIMLVLLFGLFGLTIYFLMTEDATVEFAGPNTWKFP
jgi:hypothetical protein